MVSKLIPQRGSAESNFMNLPKASPCDPVDTAQPQIPSSRLQTEPYKVAEPTLCKWNRNLSASEKPRGWFSLTQWRFFLASRMAWTTRR